MTDILSLNKNFLFKKSSQKSKSSPTLNEKSAIINIASTLKTNVSSPRKNMRVKFDSSIFLDDLFRKALRLSFNQIKIREKILNNNLKFSIGIDIICYGAFNAKMAYVLTKPDGKFNSIHMVDNHIGNLRCDDNQQMTHNEIEFVLQFHIMMSKIFQLFGKRWYEMTDSDLRLPNTAMFKIVEKNQIPHIWFDETRNYCTNQILTKFFSTMLECIGIDISNPSFKWNDRILKLCVALPSDFHSYQRLCLKNCFEQIGLKNKFLLVNKSTSLALPFIAKQLNDPSKKFILDFGSGYMNCSIIECLDNNQVNVIDQLADKQISSKKFFEKCYKCLKSQSKQQNTYSTLNITLARYDLYNQMNVEREKTAKNEIWTVMTQDQEFLINMKKNGIEQLATTVIEKLKKTSVMQDNKIVDEISDILVCSDAVLYEYLEPLLKHHCHKNMNIIFMDNDCASIGAAFLSSSTLKLTTNDMLPNRIGVGLYNGVVKTLIESKTNFPCSGSHMFQTLIDNQTILRINLYEGESPLARYCKHISEFVIENIRKAPAGSIKIEVTIEFDQNGVLNAEAKDVDKNESLSIRINVDSVNCFETIKRSKYAIKNTCRPSDGSDSELAKRLQDFDFYFDYLIGLYRNSPNETQMVIKKKIYLAKKFISKNRLRITDNELNQLRTELDEVLNQFKPVQSISRNQFKTVYENKSNYCIIL